MRERVNDITFEVFYPNTTMKNDFYLIEKWHLPRVCGRGTNNVMEIAPIFISSQWLRGKTGKRATFLLGWKINRGESLTFHIW